MERVANIWIQEMHIELMLADLTDRKCEKKKAISWKLKSQL